MFNASSSPLPLYRGSPIQNQIIAGEKQSMVSIFIMTDELDAGDIVGQKEFSLIGNLNDIFNRIEDCGIQLTRNLLNNGLHRIPQNHSNATFCKRRTHSDSEISANELATQTAEYLHNKIRMLNDPYPNAYIVASDGKKLFIIESYLQADP